MTLTGSGGHTHKPKADALQIAIDAFANAPVTNPDGSTGITAHIDAGSDTIMNPATGTLWGTLSHSTILAHQTNLGTTSATGAYNWAAFDAIKGVGTGGSFDVQRAVVFHYSIFGHSLATSLTTTSGISRGVTASDFLVTLGGWTSDVGSVNEQAGTLIHEFGHNLGLRHGGDDHANYEPNYSRFLLPSLNESTLNETIGLSGVPEAANYGTRYSLSGTQLVVNSLAAIDWNNDGDSTDNPVAIDINRNSVLNTLVGQDDWDNIAFNGGAVGHLGEQIELPLDTSSDDITEPEDGQLPTDFACADFGSRRRSSLPREPQFGADRDGSIPRRRVRSEGGELRLGR